MAKSKIIIELVNNEITIDVALKRLMLLANDLGDNELKTWAEKELNGYDKYDEVPEYRKINSINLHYSGINGSLLVNNGSLPLDAISENSYNKIRELKVKESISNVEKKSNVEEGRIGIDRSYLAGEVWENTSDGYNGIECTSITQILQSSKFADIVNELTIIVLNIFLKLDKTFGNLDDLDIDTTKTLPQTLSDIKNQINILIFEDNSIKIGNDNKIEKSNIGNGDKK